jgi:hypothetical protein
MENMKYLSYLYDTRSTFLLGRIDAGQENIFVLCIVGKFQLPILKTSTLFGTANCNTGRQNGVQKRYDPVGAPAEQSGLEHCGANWVILSDGSRFARALRSWDGIDGNDSKVFGVTGAEWERPPARTATIWTQDIDANLSMVEFQVVLPVSVPQFDCSCV